MRVAILAVAVLVGCGGGRRELRQAVGPVARPVPSTPTVGGYAPVGTGLPGERMPSGESKPSLPRSPNKSNPPARTEKVIMAADDAKAGRLPTPYEVSALNPAIPGMPKSTPDECAKQMTQALQEASPGLLERDLDTSESICLDGRLYGLCIEWRLKGRTDELAEAIRRRTQEALSHLCSRDSETVRVQRLVRAVRNRHP